MRQSFAFNTRFKIPSSSLILRRSEVPWFTLTIQLRKSMRQSFAFNTRFKIPSSSLILRRRQSPGLPSTYPSLAFYRRVVNEWLFLTLARLLARLLFLNRWITTNFSQLFFFPFPLLHGFYYCWLVLIPSCLAIICDTYTFSQDVSVSDEFH